MAKAIFLDRDGTLNRETGYLRDWAGWQWLPGVPETLALLCRHGYNLVVVTNQSGLARGFYDAEAVTRLHELMNRDLAARNAVISAFYYCPHHPDFTGPCACRKPKPGMLLRAAAEMGLNRAQSWMIGDKALDIEAGLAAGCRPVLVRTGYGRDEEEKVPASVHVADDLAAAAAHVLRNDAETTRGSLR
ncbi:MAG: D-glycero-beta-D-manno-heptose 1,7-bisphosphate 7-phosphatase [Desulfovibrio sp.]|jgi:D-glycero-D-manno-heptose 1,7-bisphosphate phosphatase|nr:D-glycero-beta-D-manno-heptose 1,7-bisphosphate 7-phosphatase [Desulfovibrio sp.]